jgi:molybdopterin synthase sulfur carrier subunit
VAHVKLNGPLKKLAGGNADHSIEGGTVRDLLRELERTEPAVSGWILDERGQIRQHINVFVNGEYGTAETAVGPDDRIHVLQAISGG